MIYWKCVGASVIGTSHSVTGLACQDAWTSWPPEAIASREDVPIIAVFVSDGAGSAAKGGVGARTAVDVAYNWANAQTIDFSIKYVTEIVRAIRTGISEQAEFDGLASRDYACTFLGLIAGQCQAIIFQIGDGAIVVDQGAGFNLPISPMHGEYVSSTYFVTDHDALEVIRIEPLNGPITRAALLTDGLERLTLDMTSKKPFIPFFNSVFETLKKVTPAQQHDAEQVLEAFLCSDRVNDHTDDDKTLVLIMSCQPQ